MIFEWAGRYRQVNVSKGGFLFAAASQVPRLMAEFEVGPLVLRTPLRAESPADVARALAVVHAELVLIHPFREGNGRLARMLCTLMALQAGAPPLDFGGIKGARRREYFAAVQAGLTSTWGRSCRRAFLAVGSAGMSKVLEVLGAGETFSISGGRPRADVRCRSPS